MTVMTPNNAPQGWELLRLMAKLLSSDTKILCRGSAFQFFPGILKASCHCRYNHLGVWPPQHQGTRQSAGRHLHPGKIQQPQGPQGWKQRL